MRLLVRLLPVPVILASIMAPLTAASGAIGFAVTDGNFRIDASAVSGNGTLFEGSVIETAKAPSQLQLRNGTLLRLATESRARVFEQRVVLEKGFAQIEGAGAYPLEAGTLRILAAGPATVTRVRLSEEGKILVASLKGTARVTTAAGLAVGNLAGGTALEFDPQAGASGPSKVGGCLERLQGNFTVVDTTTHVTVRVAGDSSLGKEVGNFVELTGAQDPTTQTLNVSSIKRISKGGCGPVGKDANVKGGAALVGGVSTVAIIGGVVAAGTIGGLAAAGTFSGSDTPAASR